MLDLQEERAAGLGGDVGHGGAHEVEGVVVETLRERIEQAMGEPVHCSGHSVDLSLTYGLADSGDPAQDATALPVDTLLRNAEVALHSRGTPTLADLLNAPLQMISPPRSGALKMAA